MLIITLFQLVLSIVSTVKQPVISTEGGRYKTYQATPFSTAVVEPHARIRKTVLDTEESIYRVVVDVSENKGYLYKDGVLFDTYPVSTGSPDRYEIPYETPIGLWKIVSKVPSRGVYGPYFLRLAKWDGYEYIPTSIGLHGTDEPELIGTPASHGCIRHENNTISTLYNLLPIGTIVETRN